MKHSFKTNQQDIGSMTTSKLINSKMNSAMRLLLRL